MCSISFKCKFDKYFIGKTSKKIKKSTNNGESIYDIKNYKSSCAWTNKYKLESVIEITEKSANNLTLEYMDKYGIENVRGGSWQQLELTDVQIGEIRMTLEVKRLVKYGHELTNPPKSVLQTTNIGQSTKPSKTVESKNVKFSETNDIKIIDRINFHDNFPEEFININSREFLTCCICNNVFDSADFVENHEKHCANTDINSKGVVDYLSDVITCSFGAMNYVSSFIQST